MKKSNYIYASVAAAAVLLILYLNCKKKKCACGDSSGSGGGASSNSNNQAIPQPTILIQQPVKPAPVKPIVPLPIKIDTITETPPNTFAARFPDGSEFKYYNDNGRYYRTGAPGLETLTQSDYVSAWKNYKI